MGPVRIGVAFFGRQSPGGHDVIAGGPTFSLPLALTPPPALTPPLALTLPLALILPLALVTCTAHNEP